MSLLKKIGILFLITFSISLKAQEIWPKKSLDNSNIRDLAFEIKTKSLSETLNLDSTIKAKVFWLKDKKDIEFYKNSIDPAIIPSLENNFLNKLNIIIGNSFKEYVINHKYIGYKDGWHRYEDPIGVEDKSEILIKKKKLKVNIIEKKSVGTIYIEYLFENQSGVKVLKEIQRKSFVGLQSFKTTTKISYGEYESYKLPKLIEVKTIHKLTTNDNESPERELSESYELYDFKINKSVALKWFSKK